MPTKFLIIESPGKRRKLSAILGPGWRVEATVGHVRDLHARGMSVGSAPDFEPSYEIKADRREIVKKLSRMVVGGDVYLAMDPDREGEAIGWHIAQCLGLRNPKRVRFNEITASAVLAAVEKPDRLDLCLIQAQETRRVVDRLVGYGASGALTRRVGELMTAGRVQTPAVRLVADREREIAAFAPKPFFGVRLHGRSAAGAWWLDFSSGPSALAGLHGVDDKGLLVDRARADRYAGLQTVTVSACEDVEEKEAPPPPFVTSSLQQAASVKLGYSPQRTMELAQQLYESGVITYHRTDNPNLTDDAWRQIAEWGGRAGTAVAPALRTFKVPAAAQAGHTAISPTSWDKGPDGVEGDAGLLYRLIWTRATASQLEEARYSARRVVAVGADLARAIVNFAGAHRRLVHAGWRAVLSTSPEEDHDAEAGEATLVEANLLPKVEVGQTLRIVRGEVLSKKTRAPRRYSAASLIAKLEREGIGRPATYAQILKTIEEQEYVAVKAKQLHATARGELLVNLLAGNFTFADIGFTRTVEAALDSVAEGRTLYSEAVAQVHDVLMGEIARFDVRCPKCGDGVLVHRIGESRAAGPAYEYWACNAWKSSGCEARFADRDGQPDFERPIVRQATSLAACLACSKPQLVLRPAGTSRTGRPYSAFWSCTACQKTFADDKGKPVTAATSVQQRKTAT